MASTTRRNRDVQQLTALMIQGGSTPGMRPGGSCVPGMQAVGQIGGTQTSVRAATVSLSGRPAPRVHLYVGAGLELL